MKKILFIASFMLIAIFACTSVYAADMTAAELLATVDSNKTITLTDDVTLTNKLTVPSTVEVIDLGGKTLNLKAGVVVNSSLEIKNGIITRDATFTGDTMLTVDGASTNLVLASVTIDGKNVEVSSGHAIYATNAKSVVLVDSTITKNNKNGAHAVGIFQDIEKVEMKNTKITDNISTYSTTLRIITCGEFIFDKDSVSSGNKSLEGAGLHIKDTNATIAGTIEGNEATAPDGNGGGLYTYLKDSSKTIIIEATAVIRDNIAGGAGGGVYVTGDKDIDAATGNVVMLGGLITGNIAKGTPAADTFKDGGGAGVYIARGTMTIEGGKIEGNTSVSGVGDGILVSNQGGNPKAGVLEVTGGYVDGEVKVSDTYADVAVKGGTFTDDVSAHIAAGADKAVVDGVTYVGVANKITVKAGLNGKATAAEKAVEGQPVKVTVTPDKNYEVASIKVTDAAGAEVAVKDNTFTMPGSDVTVEVTFKEMKKDGTPATGSMNVVMLVSAAIAITTLGVLVSKKYAKNN